VLLTALVRDQPAVANLTA